MNTHVVDITKYRTVQHPLDLIEAPEIVDVRMEERAVYYPDGYGNIVSDPNRKGIHRVGGDTAVNIVGKNSYSIEGGQYSDLYRCMTNVLKNSGVDCNGVKVRSDVTPDGAIGYVSMTLPEYTIEVANGDESQFQISGRTSFNGIWPTVLQIGAIRIICTNSQAFIENFSMYKAKHTPSFDITHAQRKLQKALEDYRAEGERWKRWTKNDISDREAFNVFALAAKCKIPLTTSMSVSVTDLLNDRDHGNIHHVNNIKIEKKNLYDSKENSQEYIELTVFEHTRQKDIIEHEFTFFIGDNNNSPLELLGNFKLSMNNEEVE